MIKAKDAIAVARSLIGTPYKELDCINLIKKVIRDAPGGVKNYSTAGTNALWKSFEASAKYRDLTWRQESIDGAKAGMLVFKRSGSDVHHVGIVTGEGTVIHSSSVRNGVGVVETALDGTWHLLGIHRHIRAEGAAEGEETTVEAYKMQVQVSSGVLNVRNEPGKGGDIIGKLNDGAVVTVQAEFENGWKYVVYGDSGNGYVSGEYLVPYTEPETQPRKEKTTLVSADGVTIRLDGDWRVADD